MTNDGELRILSRDMTEAVRMAAERDRERELADTLAEALQVYLLDHKCPAEMPEPCLNAREADEALRQWREARKDGAK